MLFDIFHMPEDIFSIVFATEQQITVAKMLIAHMKQHSGEMSKSEMSNFANNLHGGMDIKTEIVVGPIKKEEFVKVSYNKRQFYDRIVTPMKSMGMIDYDLYKKKYILSNKFTEEIAKIGALWKTHLEAP